MPVVLGIRSFWLPTGNVGKCGVVWVFRGEPPELIPENLIAFPQVNGRLWVFRGF